MPGVDIATLGLEVKSDGVKTASDRLSEMTQRGREAEDSGNKLTAAADKTSAAFGNMASYVKAAAVALAGWQATKLAQESTLLAARVETLGVVMHAVGKNVLYTNSQMDEYAKGVAKMGITTEGSRASIIKMAQANIQLTNSQELARIAQNAAVIANTNSSDALDKMTTGIATGQAIILHHMGLMVNFEKGYKDLADTLGKTTAELTEEEKSLARVNEVKRASINISGAYEASMTTAGKAMNSLKRFTDELKLSLGEVFLPAFTASIFAVTDGLKLVSKHTSDIKDVATNLIELGLIAYFGKLAAPVYDAARAQALYTASMLQGRVVTLGSAQANLQQTASQVESTQATLAASAARLEEAEATLAAVSANRTYLVVNGMANVSMDVRIASQKELIVADAQLAAAEAEVAAAAAAVTAGEAAAAAAGIAYSSAMAGATIGAQVMAAAQVALTGVLGGLKIALALVGGEIGLIILTLGAATIAWDRYKTKQEEVRRESADVANLSLRAKLLKENKELEELIKTQSQTPAQAAAAKVSAAQEQLNNLKKEQLSLQVQLTAAQDMGDTKQAAFLQKKLDDVKLDLNIAPRALEANKKLLDQQVALQAARNKAATPAADPEAAKRLAEQQATYDRQIWDAERAQKLQDRKNDIAMQETLAQQQLDDVKRNSELGLITEKTALDQSYQIRREVSMKKLDLLNEESNAAYEAYKKTSTNQHTDLLQQMQDWGKYTAAVAAAKQQAESINSLDAGKKGDDAMLLQKQGAQLEALNEQLLEATSHYEEAALARQKFEKTSPAYKATTDAIRQQLDALSALAVKAAKLKDLTQVTDAEIQLADAMGDALTATKKQIELSAQGRDNLSEDTKAILKQVDAIKLRNAAYAASHANDELKDRVAVAQTDTYRQQEEAQELSYKRQMDLEKQKYDVMIKGSVAAANQLEKMKLLETEHAEWSKKNEEEKWKSNIGATANALGQIGEVMMKGNKDQFEAGKGMMMAQAIMAAALAIVQCYAQLGPIGGTIAAVGVGVATAAQIASIADTEYQKKALGGMVTGGQPGKDSVPTLLMPGEIVINENAVRSIGAGALLYANATGRLPKGYADGGLVGTADNYSSPTTEYAAAQLSATRDNTRAVARLSETFHSVTDTLKDQVLSATNNGLVSNRIAGMGIEKDPKSTILGTTINAMANSFMAPIKMITSFFTGDMKGYAQSFYTMMTLGFGGSLFGGNKSVKGAGVQLDYHNGAVGASQYTDIHTSGGLFAHSKDATFYAGLDKQLTGKFQEIAEGIATSVNTAGKALGGLTVNLRDVNVAATKLDLRGMNDEQANKAIEAWFQNLANAMASKIGGPDAQAQLASVTHFGETSYDALMRVTMALQTVREAGMTTGGVLLSNSKDVAITNGELADSLVKAFGGLTQFTDAVDKYNKVVNTDAGYQAIKVAAAHREVSAALAGFNVAAPETIAQYKSLVQHTDPSSPLYVALLKLTDAFDTIGTASKQAADAATALAKAQTALNNDSTSRLLRATGQTDAADLHDMRTKQTQELTDAQTQGLDVTTLLAAQTAEYTQALTNLTKAQADSRAGYSDDLQLRQLRSAGSNDLADLTEMLISQEKELADTRGKGYNIAELLTTQEGELAQKIASIQSAASAKMMDAQLTFNETVASSRDKVATAQKAYDDAVAARAKQAAVDAVNAQIQSAQKIAGAWRSAADGLKTTIDNLKTAALTVLGPQALLQSARGKFDSTYNKAIHGDADAAGQIGQLGSDYSTALRNSSASREAYLLENAKVVAQMTKVQALSDSTATAAERQTELLQNQLAAINKGTDTSVEDAAAALQEAKDQLAALEALGLETKDIRKTAAQQAVDALIQAKAEYEATLGIKNAALDQYALHQKNAEQAHQDAAAITAALNARSMVADPAATPAHDYRHIGEPKKLPEFAIGTSYVRHDMDARIHEGEKILDAQSSSILSKYGIKVSSEGVGDTSTLEALVEELRAEIQGLREEQLAANAALAKNSGELTRLMKRWDGNGLPETRVA